MSGWRTCSPTRAPRACRCVVASAVVAFTVAVSPAAADEPIVIRDVSYVADGGPDRVLDLHVPDADGFATVIFVHGGSLRRGDSRSSELYANVCEPFVAARLGCATIDYRVAPESRWPAMPDDVAASVRWVRDGIGERGGDPSRLFLFGHSSGCHLTAVVGANPKYLAGVGLTTADLAGIIPMGCVLTPLATVMHRAEAEGVGLEGLRARWKEHPDDRFASFEDRLDSDPSRFVGPHVPPALIVIAREERFRPPILEQAARFVDLMYRAGRPADIVIVPGSHNSSIAAISNEGDPTFEAILGFIENPNAAGDGSRPPSIGHGD